jgi:S-DNA-T family DNA segregation ATPase FtsK/SpoIIIE
MAGDTDATVVAERVGFGALHATAGPLAGQSFPLKMDGFYIGRDRSVSQVVLDTPSVSKRHVWVGIREGVPTAIDQSSTNGTYLNTLGTRIGQVRLTPGDTLIISDDVARFVYRV